MPMQYAAIFKGGSTLHRHVGMMFSVLFYDVCAKVIHTGNISLLVTMQICRKFNVHFLEKLAKILCIFILVDICTVLWMF